MATADYVEIKGIRFPVYQAPQSDNDMSRARLYILNNILGEFNHAVKKYDTPAPKKDIQTIDKRLAGELSKDLRDRCLQHRAVASFRASIESYRAFFENKLAGHPQETLLQQGDHYLNEFKKDADRIWLPTNYRDNKILHTVAEEVESVVRDDFDTLLTRWQNRVADAANLINLLCEKVMPVVCAQFPNLTKHFEELAKTSITVAMARRGSEEYTNANLNRYNHLYTILSSTEEILENQYVPKDKKVAANIVRRTARLIDSMGMWGRTNDVQCNELITRITSIQSNHL